jgi:hypothetical protein
VISRGLQASSRGGKVISRGCSMRSRSGRVSSRGGGGCVNVPDCRDVLDDTGSLQISSQVF